MVKRLLAGPLWFVAMLSIYGVVAFVLGTPHEVGPIIAFVVATLVVLDPGGLIWPPVTRPAPHTSARPRPLTSPAKPAD